MKPRFFVYATDPEEQEEEARRNVFQQRKLVSEDVPRKEDPDACEDSGWLTATSLFFPASSASMNVARPLWDASCLWLAASEGKQLLVATERKHRLPCCSETCW